MDEPVQAMENRLQDGALSPAHPLGICHVMFGSVITAGKPTTQLSGVIEAFQFFSFPVPFPRGSRACNFCDSQHAADVFFGSVQPRTTVRLAGTSRQLLFQKQLRVSVTLRHIYSHGGNVGN